MVVTRRGALAKAQIAAQPARREPRARQLSSSKLEIRDSTVAKQSKRGRRKKPISAENVPADPQQQAAQAAPKPSLFGFKYDHAAAATSVPPFNPAICYQFVSSCPAPNPEHQDGHLAPSAAHAQHPPPPSIPRCPRDDQDFEKMKTAITSATRILVSRLTRQPLPEESRAIMEGVMAEPELRARVPANLLEEYDAAMAMEDGGTGRALIKHLIASTSKATQIAKQMVENQKQRLMRQRARQDAQRQQSGEEPEVDPAFESVLRTALTSCNLALIDGSSTQPTPDPNVGPSNPHHSQRPAPFHPTGEVDPMDDDDMAGFEVESVAPTIISAPAPAPGPSQAFAHPVTPPTPTPATAQVPTTIPELSNPRDALMQTNGVDLSRIHDPNSREYRCVRKARALLAAIRMTAGTEEAEEVYTGFQLVTFYDMVGILSTDLYSTTYRQHLQEPTPAAHPPSVAGPSQAGLGLPQTTTGAAASLGLPPQTGYPAHSGLFNGFGSSAPTGLPTPLETSRLNPGVSFMDRLQGPASPRRPSKLVQPSINQGFVPGMSKAAFHPGLAFQHSSGIHQPTNMRFGGDPQASTSNFVFPSGVFNPTANQGL